MATQGTPSVPFDEVDDPTLDTLRRPWRMRGRLSSFAGVPGDRIDGFLGASGFDRGPWVTVGFASGIGLWFALDNPWQWAGAIVGLILTALGGATVWRGREDRAYLLISVVVLALTIAAGIALVWTRSELVGAQPIDAPRFERIDARILSREEQPSENRIRLVLAARDTSRGRAVAYRVNVDLDEDTSALREGARVRLAARLMPPSPPVVPGAYNFARRAWFDGLAATGSVVGPIEIVEEATGEAGRIAGVRRALSGHVRRNLDGSSGAIAATLASGDRGSIPAADEVAMRDAGLTHLLSISGLHVSAIIAAAFLVVMRVLSLWPWLALRVRLPLAAAGVAALVGVAYTLLTGAEVPTVRSCIGALLVLGALAMGREPLSLRMVAVAAMIVLCLWPEALVGPSFQMSFAAVLAIVALHNAEPIREYLAPREEGWWRKAGRRVVILFPTGLVIEIALMPIVLFHFHRAGIYGSLANLLAIPLVTFVSMPLVAIALLLDLIGAGSPAWWLVGKSLDLLLGIAHTVSDQPGAVKLAPRISLAAVLVFVGGGLWLALWRGPTRLWGLGIAALGALMMWSAPPADMLITRDGRDVGIRAGDGRLLVLRDSAGSYAQDNLREMSAIQTPPIPLAEWQGARCSPDFCSIVLDRGQKPWRILVARSRNLIEERALAAACEQADIVIADRYLPYSCRPIWLKADRRFLQREGGTALYLHSGRVETVAQGEGRHGWWRPVED